MRPMYWELVDALVGMSCQYLGNENGELEDGMASAGEHAVDALMRLGLVRDGSIIQEAFDHEWLQPQFPEICGNPTITRI